MSIEPHPGIDHQLFRATPPELADEMAREAMRILTRFRQFKPRLLEPSAGGGALARAARKAGAAVLCVEKDERAADDLIAAGYPTVNRDFLKLKPSSALFDGALMNPPARDEVAHVTHALQFVRPGGVIVAVMSPSWQYRVPRFKNFAEFMHSLDAQIRELPDGTFRNGGRPMAAVVLTVTVR